MLQKLWNKSMTVLRIAVWVILIVNLIPFTAYVVDELKSEAQYSAFVKEMQEEHGHETCGYWVDGVHYVEFTWYDDDVVMRIPKEY